MGFATRVCEDPRAEALKVAREIAGKSPDAIRAAKRIYNVAGYRSAADGLMDESIEQARLIGSPNQVEAVMANLEKREPRFAD
jgi:enoyl-CoA hydratase/carnithine racemase